MYRGRITTQQKITIARKEKRVDSVGDVTDTFGTRSTVWAAVYPVSSELDAQTYGQKIAEMRKIITAKATDAEIRDAVWLDGDDLTQDAPWRIASVQQWTQHTNITIERAKS